MVAHNILLTSPPYPVEKTLKQLGVRLRTARVRRRLTIKELAEKIGTGTRAISDAERGKPSTSIATYVAILWVFDLLSDLEILADPSRDIQGQALALSREGVRVRPQRRGLDNDF